MSEKTEIIKAIGERIREARKSEGLTQADLAELINSSNRLISDVENAKKNTSIERLYAISKALGVSFEFLITGLKNDNDKTDKIITLYNRLSRRDQMIVEKQIQSLLETKE